MKVVVGLGNPGQKYAGTRHNVGFDVVEKLAARHPGAAFRNRFESELCEIEIHSDRLLLVAPQTFMNLSGRAVRAVLDFYKLAVKDVLVVCDDLNLEPGRLRLRASGSAGGQKGLQDIINHLGTQDVARLRIGIGRPPGRMDAAAYVLQRVGTRERDALEVAIVEAAEAAALWATKGIEKAMNLVNGPPTGGAKDSAAGGGRS